MLINRPGPSVTKSQCLEFEKEIKFSFPSDYRNFLIKSNGGVLTKGFKIDGEIFDLVFHGLREGNTGLRRAVSNLNSTGHRLLPFGNDIALREFFFFPSGEVGAVRCA